MELIYHQLQNRDAVSPFQTALVRVSGDGSVDIACPYIGHSLLMEIITGVDRWRLVTDLSSWFSIVPNHHQRMRLANWCIAQGGRVRHLTGLHAKVVVGREHALVGSANLTDMGTLRRVEMGILLSEPVVLMQLQRWFDDLWAASVEPSQLMLEAVTKGVRNTPADAHPERSNLPDLLGASPVQARSVFTNRGTTLSWTVRSEEDIASDTWNRLKAAFAPRTTRQWANSYFNWLEELIRITALAEGDRQLTTTLVANGRLIGVNINNRSALSWYGGRWHQPPRIYYLLPRDYVNALQRQAPELVYRRHDLRRDHHDPEPPTLIVAEFPPPVELSADFREQWGRALRYEVKRRRGHSPQGGRKHEPLIYHLATDHHLREAFLAELWDPAHL